MPTQFLRIEIRTIRRKSFHIATRSRSLCNPKMFALPSGGDFQSQPSPIYFPRFSRSSFQARVHPGVARAAKERTEEKWLWRLAAGQIQMCLLFTHHLHHSDALTDLNKLIDLTNERWKSVILGLWAGIRHPRKGTGRPFSLGLEERGGIKAVVAGGCGGDGVFCEKDKTAPA